MLRLLVPCVALVSSLAAYLVHRQSDQLVTGLGRRLEAIAATAATAIDGDVHESIQSADHSEFARIRDALRKIEIANGLESPIYTLRPQRNGDDWEFVVMTNEEPFVGTPYSGPPELYEALSAGASHSSDIYRSENGTWLSGFAPIHNSAGAVVGVVEVDHTAGHVSAVINQTMNVVIATVIAVVLLLALVALLTMRRMLAPLDALLHAVGDVERDQFDSTILESVARHAEFATLATSVTKMARAVRSREDDGRRVEAALRETNALRGAMLSRISHELRTPVTTLVSDSELLASGFEMNDAEREEFVQQLHAASVHLQNLVDRVFQVAELQAQSDTPEMTPVPAQTLIQTLLEQVSDRAEHAGVKLVNHGFHDVVLSIDFELTTQALVSVIDNAFSVSRPGDEVIIGLEVEGDRPTIRVRDHGPGIPDHELPKLFQPFEQGGAILEDKPEGLGLGLTLARLAMRQQEGDVNLVQTSPEGTEFELTLPPSLTLSGVLRRVPTA